MCFLCLPHGFGLAGSVAPTSSPWTMQGQYMPQKLKVAKQAHRKKSRRLLTIIATPIICMIRTMHAYRRECIGLMRMAHVRIHTLELEFSSLLGMLIFKSPIYGLKFQGSSSAWAWSQLSLVVAGGEVLRLVFQAAACHGRNLGLSKTLGSLEVGFQWTIVVCASVTECIPLRPQLRIKSPRGPSHQARLNKSDPPKHSPKSSWQFDHHGCPLSPLPGFPTQHKFFKYHTSDRTQLSRAEAPGSACSNEGNRVTMCAKKGIETCTRPGIYT